MGFNSGFKGLKYFMCRTMQSGGPHVEIPGHV